MQPPLSFDLLDGDGYRDPRRVLEPADIALTLPGNRQARVFNLLPVSGDLARQERLQALARFFVPLRDFCGFPDDAGAELFSGCSGHRGSSSFFSASGFRKDR